MASPNIYQNGVGATTGAALALLSPLYTSGSIWYVYSVTGADAVSPAGKDRSKPLATLAQAHTNAAAGDIIVCLSGHVESLSAAQTFNTANILVLGEGSGSSRPRFTRTGDVNMFDVTAAGVMFANIFFPASTLASTKSRVRFAGINDRMVGCYFECGALDNGPSLETVTGAAQVSVTGGTYFVSTATSLTAQPDHAIKLTNAITDLELDTVIMDGGSTGWANQFALNGAGAVTRLRATNIDLLGDSDVTLATGTTGHVAIRNQTGSARIVWTA